MVIGPAFQHPKESFNFAMASEASGKHTNKSTQFLRVRMLQVLDTSN